MLDSLLIAADNALRAVFAPPRASRQPGALPAATPLTEPERRHAAGLMRINHAGEVAAQALYHAQAFVAREPATREFMLKAAREEGDHLAWCQQRLEELGDHRSHLTPFWYAGSFAIGVAAALAGDRWSLGFVSETERQVEGHLADHLQRLPPGDARSRRILEVMQAEEVGHADQADAAGARELPHAARQLMRTTSRVMTHTAYRV